MSERRQVEVRSRQELRDWLAAHHAEKEGIWLVTAKKSAGDGYLPYDAIVEEALAAGWIDSIPRKLDERRSMRMLSPRKPGSAWSARKKAMIARLERDGSMTEPGRRSVERAKRDGSWNRIDAVEALEVPHDLAAALAKAAPADACFNAFPRSSRRLILEWIAAAKRPQTRAARILETASLAAQNRRANRYRQPKGSRKK